ncbi:MAG: hypothetical protein JXR25_14960 [Pontiellaceae bacterium]|nr:hypothetical protein [Pontiellaceae bacterium]MBN2786119.1 hypothetical protein [Pontiellaceae bacterium]
MKSVMSLLILTAAMLVHLATAAPVLYELASDSSMINHWPGPDGMVGTSDDVVDGTVFSVGGSGPNTPGALSSGSFDFGPRDPESKLASPYDAVTFVNLGTISFDSAAGSGSPLIQSFNMESGTEPYIGHGPYSAVTTGPLSGTSTATTFSLTNAPYDTVITTEYSTNYQSGVMNMSGIYRVVNPSGPPTGVSYLDSVLTPIAKVQGAKSYLMLTGTGSTGVYGDIPIQFTLVGFEITAATGVPLQPSLSGSDLLVIFDTEARSSYQLQRSTNLMDWVNFQPALIGDGLGKTQAVSTVELDTAFIRVMETAP